MILPKPIVGKIIRGEVTMTYKPASTRRPRVGERLFVKARQSDPVACHVVVKGSWEGRLGALTFEDARACGYRARDGFRDAWLADHDRAWLARWADLDADALELAFRVRWDGRWRNVRANIITFEIDHSEHPRLLADRNVRADYVESPARAMGGTADPGEAIDARLQDRYSREGHQGFVARERARELDREHLLAEERIHLGRIEARAQGLDIAGYEAAILQRVRAMERKIYSGKTGRKAA